MTLSTYISVIVEVIHPEYIFHSHVYTVNQSFFIILGFLKNVPIKK